MAVQPSYTLSVKDRRDPKVFCGKFVTQPENRKCERLWGSFHRYQLIPELSVCILESLFFISKPVPILNRGKGIIQKYTPLVNVVNKYVE